MIIILNLPFRSISLGGCANPGGYTRQSGLALTAHTIQLDGVILSRDPAWRSRRSGRPGRRTGFAAAAAAAAVDAAAASGRMDGCIQLDGCWIQLNRWIQMDGWVLTVMGIARVLSRDAPELTLEIDGDDAAHLRPVDALHRVADVVVHGGDVAVWWVRR